MENKITKPGKWLYGLAGGIALFGVLIMVLSVFYMISNSSNMERIVIPGGKDVKLEKSGKYVIYHEYKSEIDGNYYFSKNLEGFDCKIFNVETKEEIFVNSNFTSSTYSYGGKEGKAILNFEITDPGIYNISARLMNNQQTVLSIGQGDMFISMILLSVSIFVLVFCLLAAKAIVIITFVMRRRNKFQ